MYFLIIFNKICINERLLHIFVLFERHCVDSCQQKESLIRQLQESNSQEAAKQHTMTIELQCVQDELRKYQENEGRVILILIVSIT